jgi:hypothetical protein
LSKIITPTVSRKVWYRPAASDLIGLGAMTVATGQPLDATVLAVWGDRCINAEVKDVCGKHFVKMSATLVQDGDALPMHGLVDGELKPTPGGYFQWMPHQAGQAKKDVAPATEPDPAAAQQETAQAIQHTEDPDHGDDAAAASRV